MKVQLVALVVLCLTGLLSAEAQPGDNGLTDNEQRLERRYAESTLASDMGILKDSMLQKNFVNYLLSQQKKRDVTPEEDPEARVNNLLRKITLCIRNK